MNKRFVSAIGIVMVAVFGLSACTSNTPPRADSQRVSQNIVEQYQAAAEAQTPYPLEQMVKGGWLERTLLTENLLRQNDKNRVAWVILMNVNGAPITQFKIQGMVFSLNSQLTTEDKVKDYCGSSCINLAVTKSPGDNGTWGPEPDAIGFFTTEGVEIKWNGIFLESDAPLTLNTPPLIVYDVNSKPSVSAGGVKSLKDGGIKVNPGTVPVVDENGVVVDTTTAK